VLLVRGGGPFARQVIEGAEHVAAIMGLQVDVAELASWRIPSSLAGRGLLIAGAFDQDVDAVRRVRTAAVEVELVGCVGAGIDEFRVRLGPLAEGVLAPVQWVNRDHRAEVGPTSATFARRFEARTGATPDYPAAQAAATGWLAAEATRQRLEADEVQRWHTSTLLGAFALDSSWRQVGHTPTVVQWHHGRLDTI
jgi:ABC-type branched-subunit amino acid transport system substrate-binding protein